MVREQGFDDPKSRDFLPIGVEVAVGRLLNLSEGNHSALDPGAAPDADRGIYPDRSIYQSQSPADHRIRKNRPAD